MKKSKFKFISGVALSILLLAACGDSENADTKSADAANDDKEKYTINIAYGNQPGEPIDQLAKKWEELAEEKSGGQLDLVLYPSSQLGAEKDVIEQAIQGNNVIVLAGYDFLLDYVPDAGILTAPYLTDDTDLLRKITDTEWFSNIDKQLVDKGINIIIPNVVYGERHLMTGKKVETPADLAGLKVRVPNNQMSIKTMEALGAAATPLPLADLYPSLQQGLIDGAENPISVLQGAKVQEVAKYLSLTGHQRFIVSFAGGVNFTNGLPEEIVKILKETGAEAADYGYGVLKETDQKVLEDFKAEGVEIVEVDTALFKEKVASVYDEFKDVWSDNLYENLLAELEKLK
jgi:TRAP-type transport system periplasmic protein